MKNILTILFISIITLSLNAQYGVDNIFRKYKNDKDVLAWQFEGDLSSMLGRDDNIELKSTIESVDFVMFTNGGDISEKDADKLKDRLDGDRYEMLVQARDKGQRIKILGIEEGDKIKKVFAQMKYQEMNAYFFLTGEIYLEDLQNIDFDGLFQGLNID